MTQYGYCAACCLFRYAVQLMSLNLLGTLPHDKSHLLFVQQQFGCRWLSCKAFCQFAILLLHVIVSGCRQFTYKLNISSQECFSAFKISIWLQMTYMQATQGGGGWLVCCFLTPDWKASLAAQIN